jgi:hypothetical protein
VAVSTARVDRRDGHVFQGLGQLPGLCAAFFVQVHAGRLTGHHPFFDVFVFTVTDEQQQWHVI